VTVHGMIMTIYSDTLTIHGDTMTTHGDTGSDSMNTIERHRIEHLQHSNTVITPIKHIINRSCDPTVPEYASEAPLAK